MPWHNFVDRQNYPIDEVVATCEKHIRTGRVGNEEEKMRYLELIRNCGEVFLVYSPDGPGWGSSPMNINCWRTLKDNPICTKTLVRRS